MFKARNKCSIISGHTSLAKPLDFNHSASFPRFSLAHSSPSHLTLGKNTMQTLVWTLHSQATLKLLFFFFCPRCSLHHSWSLLSILSDFSRIWGPLLSKTLNGVFAVVDGLSHYLRNMPSQDPEDASLPLRLHPKTVCLRLTFGSSFPVVPHRLPTCASHVGCFPVEHTSWYGSLDGPWNIISIFPGILVAWLSWCSGFSELLSNFCTPVIFHSLERVSSLKKKITRFDEEENTLFNYKQRYLSAFTDSFWEYLKCRNMNLSFKDSFPFS